MDPTNDHWLKITGKVNVDAPLSVDTEYQFTGIISTYGTDQSSKQDGTFNYTHKAQFVSEISLIKGEEIIRGQKKTSASQKWRRLVECNGFNYEEWMQWQFSKFNEMREEYEAWRSQGGIE